MKDRTTMTPMELMDAYHEAWARNDLEEGWSFYSEDAIFHMAGRGPLAGDFEGREAFVNGWVKRVANYTDEWRVFGDDLKTETLLHGPEGVALLLEEAWRKGDREIVTKRLGIYRIKDGEIVECWFNDQDQSMVEEFFGDLSD